jgi:hypothetical protein
LATAGSVKNDNSLNPIDGISIAVKSAKGEIRIKLIGHLAYEDDAYYTRIDELTTGNNLGYENRNLRMESS